jgi:hypothetical protein
VLVRDTHLIGNHLVRTCCIQMHEELNDSFLRGVAKIYFIVDATSSDHGSVEIFRGVPRNAKNFPSFP